MDGNAVMVVLVIVAAVVGILMFASKSKKKEIPQYTSPLNDPGYRWRGEKGSSGNPDFKHSSNCECHMCLYHHDPSNRGCKCRVCSDPAAFYGR
jgi:hypothetical protein